MPFIVLSMVICIVVAVFALQNSLVVPVKFIFVEQEASLVLVILISAFLGLMIGLTVIMYIKFKNYLGTRKSNDKIKKLTEENVLLVQQVASLETRINELKQVSAQVTEPQGTVSGEIK